MNVSRAGQDRDKEPRLGRRKWMGEMGVTGAVGLSLMVGCAPGAAPSSPAPTPAAGGTPQGKRDAILAKEDLLLLVTQTGLTAVSPARGRVTFAMPPALPAPDWSKLFRSTPLDVSSAAGGRTRLATLDPLTGAERAETTLEGDWQVVVASAGGGLVALRPHQDGDLGTRGATTSPYRPTGRERTTLTVADPTGRLEARRYDLEGNFEPEAFSTDGQTLFLLEYLPPLAPNRYRVMQLSLADRDGRAHSQAQVQAIFTRDKRPNPEEMRGTGRTHAFAPGCRTLYTLYTKQPDHVHARNMAALGGSGESSGMTHAFVHVLNLSERWAFCLDLPLPFGVGPSAAHALTPSPDGWRLYVVDASTGQVAVADATKLRVMGVNQLREFPGPGDTGLPLAVAAAGPGGTLYLAAGAELVAAVPASAGLAAEQRWSLDSPVRGLAASGDGERVYVGLEDRLLVLDGRDGRRLDSITVPGLESLAHVAQAPAGALGA